MASSASQVQMVLEVEDTKRDLNQTKPPKGGWNAAIFIICKFIYLSNYHRTFLARIYIVILVLINTQVFIVFFMFILFCMVLIK